MACEVGTLPFLTVLDLGRNLETKVRVVDPRSQSLAASQPPRRLLSESRGIPHSAPSLVDYTYSSPIHSDVS